MQSLNITIAFPTVNVVFVPAAPTKADSPAATLISERFKTRLCKTFRKTGACAFLARCMFAHGKEDLRTTERNVADNLVTEAAVKEWQRATIRADEKHAATKAIMVISLPIAEPASPRSVSPSDAASAAISPRVAAAVGPDAPVVAAPRTPVRRYRHDPYAQFSAWQPLLEESGSVSAESTPRALEVVRASPLSAAMGRAPKAPTLPAPMLPAPTAGGILMP